jgi:2'-5' RNA ligase
MVDDAPPTGTLFVAQPAHSDPINELSQEDQAHVTLLWFGPVEDLWPERIDAIRDHAADVAGLVQPFEAKVSGRAELGPDRAKVLLLESVDLVQLRTALFEHPEVQAAYLAARQFPWWVPHLTLTYDQWPAGELPQVVQFDGVGFWAGGQHERFALLDTLMPEVGAADDDELLAGGAVIPPVLCADDLPLCLDFAERNPDARWYADRRARALGRPDLVPSGWAAAS